MPSKEEETITRNALHSTAGISFWGGIDPLTGTVIDQTHPLCGECVSDKVLCIPGGRGSCTGSQVMLELILNGRAPHAIITRDPDPILCTGAIVAEEFFGDECRGNMAVPIICALGEENFARLAEDDSDALTITRAREDGEDDGIVSIRSGNDEAMIARDLLRLKDTLKDSGADMNQSSPAAELAMRTVRRVASVSGATELMPITSAHIDAVTYIVRVIATLGRHVQSKGNELGYTQKLESFGFQFVNDTCWCMLLEPPIVPSNPKSAILTNSSKYAHYGPGLTNRRVRFGSMFMAVNHVRLRFRGIVELQVVYPIQN